MREALDALEAEDLVARVGRGRYRTAFVALDAEDRIDLGMKIRRERKCVADVIAEALPELRAAWESSPQPGHGFDWDTGIWPVLAIMVCNTGCLETALPTPDPNRLFTRQAGSATGQPAAKMSLVSICLWSTGFSINSLRDPHAPSFHHGLFWSYGLPFARPADHPEGDGMLVVRAVANGFRDVDAIARSADLRIEAVRDAAAGVMEIEMLKREQDAALTFLCLLPMMTMRCSPLSTV